MLTATSTGGQQYQDLRPDPVSPDVLVNLHLGKLEHPQNLFPAFFPCRATRSTSSPPQSGQRFAVFGELLILAGMYVGFD